MKWVFILITAFSISCAPFVRIIEWQDIERAKKLHQKPPVPLVDPERTDMTTTKATSFLTILLFLSGCKDVATSSQQVHDSLTSIQTHVNAARSDLKPILGLPEAKAADKELAAVPSDVKSASDNLTSIEKQYSKEHNRWYAKAGRFVDAAFWTCIFLGIIILSILGAANFYTGGLLGRSLSTILQAPIAIIHGICKFLINKIRGKK